MDIERKRQTQAVDVPRLLPTKAREGEEVDERCLSCNTVHGSPRLFRLPSGKLVSSYSEEFRLYTEAKWVFKRFRTKRTRQLYLAEVANLRGQTAYHRLRDAMTEIWERSKNELS
jgi:hypothetical protein